MNAAFAIAIVGLGPKGLHSLERLLAGLAAAPPPVPVVVHAINRSAEFGVSPVYATDQPDYIVTNNSVADIDTWGDDDPPPVGGRGPDFIGWHARHGAAGSAPLTGDEYLPRALVGRYLRDCFRHLERHVPPGVELQTHVGEAEDLTPEEGHYVITLAAADGARRRIVANKILLATGHARVAPTEQDRVCSAFAAASSRARFVPFVFPVAQNLRDIEPGAEVAMKGMGLTFVDATLALTEGRGGRFGRSATGELRYRASGAEPRVIRPFSRSGLPAIPKAVDLPVARRPLTFAHPARVEAIRRRADGRQLDFARELQPLVELEMARAYYRVAMGPGLWRDRLERCGDDGAALRCVIAGHLREHPRQVPFDLTPVLDPLAGQDPVTPEALHEAIAVYLEHEIARARAGHRGSPLKAAIDIWYEVRYALQPAWQFGGLTPESQRLVAGGFASQLKRVVFGPPVQNAEKILTLARAGIVDFGFARAPEVNLDATSGRFELRSSLPGGARAGADVLIDARCLPNHVERDATPLGRALLNRGLIRPFANGSHRPGAIDMTPDTQFVVGVGGTANPDIAVIGIPTEGNLIGNLTVTRAPFSARWAARTIDQLNALAPGVLAPSNAESCLSAHQPP